MKNCKGKSPAFQFYVRDWLGDPELQKAHPITRGIWINLLCYMWDAPDKGKLKTNERELCQLGSCLPEDIKVFLADAKRLNFCDIKWDISGTCPTLSHDCPVNVLIKNRRMVRERSNCEKERTRKAGQRQKKSNKKEEKEMSQACPANVPPPSSTSTSTSTSSSIKKESTYCAKTHNDANASMDIFFELFWEAFGDKRGKKTAIKSWHKIPKLTEKLADKIVEGAKKYALERKNILAKGGTPKMAHGWLTDKRWEDELPKGWQEELLEKHKKGDL